MPASPPVPAGAPPLLAPPEDAFPPDPAAPPGDPPAPSAPPDAVALPPMPGEVNPPVPAFALPPVGALAPPVPNKPPLPFTSGFEEGISGTGLNTYGLPVGSAGPQLHATKAQQSRVRERRMTLLVYSSGTAAGGEKRLSFRVSCWHMAAQLGAIQTNVRTGTGHFDQLASHEMTAGWQDTLAQQRCTVNAGRSCVAPWRRAVLRLGPSRGSCRQVLGLGEEPAAGRHRALRGRGPSALPGSPRWFPLSDIRVAVAAHTRTFA